MTSDATRASYDQVGERRGGERPDGRKSAALASGRGYGSTIEFAKGALLSSGDLIAYFQ